MKRMICLTFMLSLIAGCGQDYNSNYGDYGQYSPVEGIDSSTPEGARLLAAYRVFQGKCFQCHSWSNYKTSAQWESAGLIVKGNSASSDVITMLKNYGGNMPPDPIAPLSTEELTNVEAWINAL